MRAARKKLIARMLVAAVALGLTATAPVLIDE
jgi:hypothetical protein